MLTFFYSEVLTLKKLTIITLLIYGLLVTWSLITLVFGWTYPRFLVGVSTLAGFLFCLLHGISLWGVKKLSILVITGFVISIAMESVGVATGWIFSPYHYTDQLGLKFFNLVPYLIPLAWLLMIYPSYIIAEHLLQPVKAGFWKILVVSALGGLVMTSWDLVMDPVMVLGGHWIWDGPLSSRIYFGIPLQNFAGWWLTTFLTFLVFMLLARRLRPIQTYSPPDCLSSVMPSLADHR